MLAELSSCSIRLKAINASIADRSNPPMGGIKPLKAFRYGSVMELTELKIGFDQSRLGNQLSKTLKISTRE